MNNQLMLIVGDGITSNGLARLKNVDYRAVNPTVYLVRYQGSVKDLTAHFREIFDRGEYAFFPLLGESIRQAVLPSDVQTWIGESRAA